MERRSIPDIITIESSGTTSTVFPIPSTAFGGFQTPAQLTGTEFSFLTSFSRDGSFLPLRKDGAVISIPVSVSGSYTFPPEMYGFPFAKIVSNSAEAAAREILVGSKT